MQIHPKDSRCYLISPSDLEGNLGQVSERDLIPLIEVMRWTKEFLCMDDPELGRDGPVCPFTKPSLKKRLFWLTVYRDTPMSLDKLHAAVMRYRDWFLELEPCDGVEAQYKTILILFPDFAEAIPLEELDKAQKALKAEFVKEGLMIGQFYENCDEPGLWNPDFRPLRSTVPMLVIRHMVHSDFPFMKSNPDYVAAFLRLFGEENPTE